MAPGRVSSSIATAKSSPIITWCGASSQLTVKLSDMKSYRAKVLGTDSRNDLALIQIDAGHPLPTLHLGDSDGLLVGQKVLAIGNPFGLEGTLTTGIVSSLNRGIDSEDNRRLEGMIQTDAAINPGNSGGPLLDSHGNVIGINTAILGSQGNIGIGFAMPINRAKEMLDEFQQHGHISRPTLGITTVWVSGELAEMLNLPAGGGLLIQRVERGSPAAEAGLRGPTQVVIVANYQLGVGGDLITAVEGQPVEGKESLQRVMDRKHGGDPLNLTRLPQRPHGEADRSPRRSAAAVVKASENRKGPAQSLRIAGPLIHRPEFVTLLRNSLPPLLPRAPVCSCCRGGVPGASGCCSPAIQAGGLPRRWPRPRTSRSRAENGFFDLLALCPSIPPGFSIRPSAPPSGFPATHAPAGAKIYRDPNFFVH